MTGIFYPKRFSSFLFIAFFVLAGIGYANPFIPSTPEIQQILQNNKGIIIEMDEIFVRPDGSDQEAIVVIAPNPVEQQSWVYGHGLSAILSLGVVDQSGTTIAYEELGRESFRLYTGKMDPGTYYLKMEVEGITGLVVEILQVTD